MAFAGRWLVSVTIMFVLFPVAFVLWSGPDADFGLLGGMILMMFLQFISPYDLWMIPLGVGTGVALGWHFLVKGNDARQSS